MLKIKNSLISIFGIVLCFCMSFAILMNIFKYDYLITYNPIIVFIGVLLFLGVLFLLITIIKNIKIPNLKYLEVILLVSFFAVYIVVQLLFVTQYETRYTSGWDFLVIASQANDYATNGITGTDYFNLYPNNAPLFVMLCGYFSFLKIFGVSNFNIAGIMLNIVMINLALLMLYLTVRKLAGKRFAALSLLIAALTAPILLYVPSYYTDTLTLAFPISAFYMWLFVKDSLIANNKKAWWQIPIMAILLGCGTSLKISVAITFIAIIIDSFFSLPLIKTLKMLVVAILSFAIVIIGVNLIVQSSKALPEKNNEYYIPKAHWIMMGLNGNGNYCDDDYKLTLAQPPEKRLQFVNDEIVRRIKSYKFSGMVDHIFEKTAFTWGDGTYTASVKLDGGRKQSSYFDRFLLYNERHFDIFAYYSEFVLVVTMMGIAAAGALIAFRAKNFQQILPFAISVMGVFLFFQIWEARTRYLFNYIPIFIVLTVMSAKVLSEIFAEKKKIR